MKAIRRSSMIEDVPLNFSKKVVVESGIISAEDRNRDAAHSKRDAVKDIVSMALMFISMFSVFLVKGNTFVLKFNRPSRVSLLSEIDRLQQDLEAFRKLKEEYKDEEAQLTWDKEHILETEHIVTSMLEKSREAKEQSYNGEIKIKEEIEHMHEDMQTDNKSSNNAAKHDSGLIRDLKKDIEDTNREIKQEQDETALLRQQITETMAMLRQKNISLPEHLHDRLNSLEYSVWYH